MGNLIGKWAYNSQNLNSFNSAQDLKKYFLSQRVFKDHTNL